MTILAATLAGGSNNQDRYFTGDGFAGVLDGATSFAGDRSLDAGVYAEHLASVLQRALPSGVPLAHAVYDAIRDARDTFSLEPATAPMSTVALARWTGDRVETYVLGDSTVALLRIDGTEVVFRDDRIGGVASEQRAAYRQRLAAGHGYDDTHREWLKELQAEQARHRNRLDGYWIAGADPDAARHGLTATRPRDHVASVLLASDGVALDRHPNARSWRDIETEVNEEGAEQVLRRIHGTENSDQSGQLRPRAKRHDDKTLVVCHQRACPARGQGFQYHM